MSEYLTSSNGSLTTVNLPKCNEVQTQSNKLVNKAYVDSNSGSGLVINQINLNTSQKSLIFYRVFDNTHRNLMK